MNELYLENGFKVYITLQFSQKKTPTNLLLLLCTRLACCWKFRKSTIHYGFNSYYILYTYFKTQEILNSLKLTLLWAFHRLHDLKGTIISRNSGHPALGLQ